MHEPPLLATPGEAPHMLSTGRDPAAAVPNTTSLQACLERLADLHPRLCPRQVLGVRMGLAAANLLQLDLPRPDKRVLAIVETDGCFADGVSVATGCWLGRRTLRLLDYGKVAVTCVDTLTGRAVRLWPHPLARTSAERYAPSATGRWEAQLLGYQRMPVERLLCAEYVALTDPTLGVLDQSGGRQLCADCGEEIINSREVTTALGTRCRGCAGGGYYRGVPSTHRQ